MLFINTTVLRDHPKLKYTKAGRLGKGADRSIHEMEKAGAAQKNIVFLISLVAYFDTLSQMAV
jgi:hypothetical protein